MIRYFKTHGENDHVKFSSCIFPVSSANFKIRSLVSGIFRKRVNPGFHEPDFFPVSGAVIVKFIILAKGTDIHVENGAVKVAA
jgi:hypothetical protein